GDAQERQKKIMQTLAIAKIATGGMQLLGAGQLKMAARGAEGAASNISEAQKSISAACDEITDLSEEQCFYQQAKAQGYSVDNEDYINYSRMRSAVSQSQEQADQANAMAKMSMVT